MNKKLYKRSYIGIFFILCILISSSFVLAYTQSYYSSQNNNAIGIGIFSSGQSLKVDDSMCQQGDDFLIQIGPLACTPSPVRSDLLAEENVNVFCQMTATQINPFVDVKRIDTINFQREYPKEVVGIGYLPAQSALGYTPTTLEGSLLLQNLGYVVITLRIQPNESALTNCKKDAFGTDICWVEGNLTANLQYDIQNVFGVGKSVFYLPVMDDSEWEKNYIASSFWEGRGYLRASSVGENDAVLSVYSDNSVASSLLSPTGRKYTLARYSSNIALKTGETSDKIFLPGLSPCLASLQLRLEGVVNPDTRARIKVNEDYDEVADGETFLDGKCTASNLERKGVTSSVKITCSGADNAIERKPFYLSISPRVNLSIGGIKKDYGVGDLLYKLSDTQNNVYKERYVYLGYVGTVGEATDVNSLYVTLVAIPSDAKDGDKNKLSDSEIASVASWSETAMAVPDTGIASVNFISSAFNKFVGAAMTVGKSVIDGQDFINIPYIGPGSAPIKFRGTDVSLMGFFSGADDDIFPSDNKNYTNAMSDFSTIVNSYPNEVEKANSIQSLGEQALYQKIYLTNALGMKKTVIELCSEFEKSYPDTYLNVGICSNIVKLSSSAVAGQQVTINGVVKIISFDGIKEPSKSDYSAELLVQGPNGKIVSYVLEKNKMVQLTGLRTADEQKKLTSLEYVQLTDLSTDSATIRVNVEGKTALQAIYISDYKLFKKGESQTWGGYTFTLKDVHLNKVAKVSVISNQDFARSNSTFNFKIGIEKRLIQLSPAKAQEKIISLNKSMGEWQKASDALYTTVKTMKAACTATGFILTAKNFLSNSGGKAIARQTVMGKTGSGGWNDKCAKLVPKTYTTLDACFLHFSDQIEKEVDNTYKIIQAQNTEISNLEKANSGSSDNAGFVGGFSKKVSTSLDSANVNQVLNSLSDEQKKNLDIDKIKGMFNSDTSFQTYYEKNTYTLDQLKEIELYSSYINQYGSDPNDQTVVNAKKNLVSVLSDVYVNSKATIEETTFEQRTGMVGNALIGSFNKLVKMQDVQVDSSNRILFKSLPYSITNADQSLKDVKISDTDYAYAIEDTSSSPAKDYIIRYNADGVVAQTYEIIPETSFSKASLKVYIGNDGKNNPNPFSLKFDKVDASSYKNPFKSSYGSSTPLIRYFETVPYKGKPAIVPFDLKAGWYAGINSPQTSYDASGRVVSFYLCNVGKDGIEEFQLDNFGGDTCQLINLNTVQTYSAFNGILKEGEVKALVDKAKNAIEQAQTARARQEGITSVNGIKVGEPPTQSSASQCADIMSASDCNILFNVCDPVICPSSRCNLGGNYPVTNVIQTGIIGSIALCLPNFKLTGGDVYIPVCLSGVQAGLDNWISIQKSYRDCLQTSIDTGETVGICDEINSIYTCEFFWKQAVPIIKSAGPKLLGKITGQSGKGGGEYQGITSALDSAKKTIDYLKQFYAANSYNAFKVRSTEQVGTELCGNFASIIYPSSGSFLDNLITPDSPVQFTGKFDEIQQTTATNPPTSQYKVYYHIYAGKDTGVYYKVYLRGSGSSYYQDTAQDRGVKSGYIAKGDYASDTVDFTAPSGYQQLCIVVNGQEECGFKEVSTSFAVNYLSDLYLAQEASNTSIKTQDECISGTTSLYNLLNLNSEAAVNNLINPQIYAQGIIRICATSDPGVGTDVNAGIEGARWKKVGICGQTGVGCWIDTESVKNVIKTMNIENKALDTITNGSLQSLSQQYLTADQFSAKMEEINAEPSNFNKVALITDVINKVYYSNQKAQLFYNRGKAYSELAIVEYNALVVAKQAATAAAAASGTTISQFDKTYISPIFEFQDGTLHKNVCYRYFDSGWHWMIASTGMGTAIIPSCNDPNFPKGRKWFNTTVFKDENDETPTDKSVSFINSLNGKLYIDGLTLLIQRTMAKNEGGISNPDLLAGDTKMSDEGIFNVNQGSDPLQQLDYRYFNSWQWSADKIGNSNWIGVTTYTVTAGNLKGEKLAQPQINLLSSIAGKGIYQGAAILFDPSSPEVKEFLKDSTTSTTGVGAIEITLDNSFARRDVNKLTNLMNDLSTSVFQSSFKCDCGANCGDYAKWITETSTINGIPDELLLLAIMIQESSCKSIQSSDGGDNGLMQINTIHCGTKGLPLMDIDACKSILLSDNAQNINIGAQILKEAYRTSGKSFSCESVSQTYTGWEAALRGYNGWGCTGDNNYVNNVESKYFELVNLYNGNPGITCTASQTKCVGTTYYICLNNAYISQGNVEGKCGYVTLTESVDLSKFSNTELDVITHASSCTNCGDGLTNSCDEAECKAIGYYLKRSCLYSFGECIENSAVTPSDESLKIELTNLLNNKLSSTEKNVVTQATACTECGKGFFNSCDEQECRALALQLKKKCAYISGTCKEDTTGTITCKDTCSSLGYKCGIQTVCEKSQDCGICNVAGQTCNSMGQCVTTGSAICTSGQTKCESTTYFTCIDNAWVSQGQVDGKCGYTMSGSGTSAEVYMIKPTLLQNILGGINGENIYYKYESGWQWTPYSDESAWMSAISTVVTLGKYTGKMPSSKNIAVIESINGKSFSDGKSIIKNSDGLMKNGSEISILSTVAGCTDTCLLLGYKCGTQTICGKSTNCGTCATDQICNSAGQCVAATITICTMPQTKCDGDIYSVCVDNAWISQGQIDGKCGYTSSTVEAACSMPQERCVGLFYSICLNNAWVYQGLIPGECGYGLAPIVTCVSGQTKCEGTTYFTCTNNVWISNGQVSGKCGYTTVSLASNREKIVSTARDLVGKPYAKYTALTYSQRAEVDKSKIIWTWQGIQIVRDYDNSGSIYPNCFDSVMHVYTTAGVKWGSFAYCLKDGLVDIDHDGCNKNDAITKDEVSEGDILSIRYYAENHNVIFLRWVDKLSGKAEIFDWIGRADKSEFPSSFTGSPREFRTFEVNLKFDGQSEDWTVYAIGKPSV